MTKKTKFYDFSATYSDSENFLFGWVISVQNVKKPFGALTR